MFRGALPALLLASSLLATVPITVQAKGSLCLRLEAELRRVGANVTRERKYAVAIRRQKTEIRRALRSGRRLGCERGSLFATNAGNRAACAALRDEVGRMRANLSKLHRFAAGKSRARARARLERAIARNGCRKRKSPRRDRKVMASPKPQNRSSARVVLQPSLYSARKAGAPSSSGYRTMCVRLCDGYYWPISFSTRRNRFAADAQVCRSSCPTAETELFIYRNPGEDVEQMVSLEGRPYVDLPAAFRYRQAFDPQCGCGAPPASSLLEVNASAEEASTTVTETDGAENAGNTAGYLGEGSIRGDIPLPVARPRPNGKDEEQGAHVDDRDAGAARDKDAGKRRVRIVGPSYYYTR